MSTWYTEEALRKADLIWLLDLTLGGASYLFATESISIDSDDGARFYDGTLTGVNVSSELEFATPDFEMPSASCQVTFRIDLAKRIAQGVDLGSATAEISLYRKNTTDDYDDRAVVLRGRVDTGSYGAIGEPVSLNIEADFVRSLRQLPEPSAVVDKSVNWPQSEDNVQGSVYPVIIGSPGRQIFAGSPIYVIENTGSGVHSHDDQRRPDSNGWRCFCPKFCAPGVVCGRSKRLDLQLRRDSCIGFHNRGQLLRSLRQGGRRVNQPLRNRGRTGRRQHARNTDGSGRSVASFSASERRHC